MEMTIDEHKEHLLDIMDSMPDDACGDWRDSLAYAINIVRKYQKIEKIINAPIGGGSAKYNAIVNLIRYSEVDNGNDY